MKHLSFIPSFVSRLVLIFAAITTLGVTNSYASWTVAGSATKIINGTATWDPSVTSNDLTETSTNNWALLVRNKNITAGNYEFKICKDHAWTEAYPASNYSLNVGTAASNILYTFNSSSHAISVLTFNTWTVAGSTAVFGSNWGQADANNDMTWSSGFEYTLTKSNVSLTSGTTYELKICKDHAWTEAYPASNKTFTVPTSGTYDVVVIFNVVTKNVTVRALRTIYFINSSNWTGTLKCYAWNGGTNNVWPGEAMTNTGNTDDCGHAIWSYKYDVVNYSQVQFNNGTNSYQTGDLTPNLTNPYYHNNNNAWYATPPAECADIYFVNTEGWANVYCYAWDPGSNGSFPGVAMTATGTTLCGKPVYRYHLTGSFSHCIFSAGAGQAKTRDLDIVPNGYFVYDMQKWFASSAAVSAACVSSSAPVMTYGAAEKIYQRKAEMQVGAVDDTTPFDELVYYCELSTPMGETYKFYQITFFANTPGYFDIINLIPCNDYTLTVWAIDNDGNMSENSIAINFTTECDPSGFYLAGSMNSWNTTDNNWKFQEHTEYNDINQDRYILIKESMTAGTTYKFVTGSTWSPDGDSCNLYVDKNAEHVVFTVKANNIHKHISSLDEIYVVGPAIGGGADGWNLTEARKLTWDNSITATWEGTVTSGAQYQLVVRTKYKCDNNSTGNYDYWIICNGNQTYNKPFTNAILTFDLLTWGWTWTNADDNLCQKTGFPPAGMTPPDFNAAKHFQMGYEISIYTPDATHLYVTAKSNDWRKKAGSATPIFMIFPQEDANLKVLEMPMVSTGTYDANGNEIFELTITQGQKANNYSTEDLVEDFTMGACIRWAVKFPYAGGFSVTDPMYYYIREGCAPYYFNIYHHDDLPGTKGDTITTFKGGEILQPIIYYRKFTPGAWETLCLPFTCSAVRVYDPDDDKEWDLVPQHNTENADYWLRTFGPATYTERDGFKPNWQNVPAGVNLPEKDVPYIMQVPGGNYYTDKYVMFYGKGYQTIANKAPWTKSSSADGFRYFGNTTMWPQNLGQAYMISADGLWFEKSDGNTLYPFECYVVADPTNTAKYVRFGGVGEQAPEVATGRPNVNDDQSLSYSYDGAQLYLRSTADTPVSIYSVDGRLILSSDLSAHIESAYTLVPGIYVVSTKLGIYKLAL